MCEAAFRLQLFDQLLKRQIRMGESVESHLTNLSQQFQKTWIARNVGSYDERIHKQTNEIFRLCSRPVSDRRTDHNISLTCIAVQHSLKGRQQSHEQSYALAPA